MTKEQFDSLYYGRAVHCDTEEKAKEFLALADSVGYKWFGGFTATEFTQWHRYKEDTHYLIRKTKLGIGVQCASSNDLLGSYVHFVDYVSQEPTHKEETTETLIDEIKAKWSEINILLNRLEKKQKGD